MKKGKLTSKQFLLILNGPSCGGKSAVSDVLFDKYGGIYKAKSDAIKWLISDYDAKRHRGIVFRMTLETVRVALGAGLSVVKEGALHDAGKELVVMAKKAKARFFVANISAPWDVLKTRFAERIAMKKKGAKISNASPKRFKELYNMYLGEKMKTELEFDSSTQSPEKIVDEIVLYIKKNS